MIEFSWVRQSNEIELKQKICTIQGSISEVMIFEKLVLKISSKFLEARDTSAKNFFLATPEIKEMASDGL